MSFKEKLKDKKDKIVDFFIEHQVEVIQTTGAVIATGIFVARTLFKKKDEDDDKQIVYDIENYYDYKIDNYYSEKNDE